MSDKFPPYKSVPVSDLVPYANNARTHSEEQVAQIAASIQEFGFISPVVIDHMARNPNCACFSCERIRQEAING